MTLIRPAVAIFVLAIGVRGFLLFRASAPDFLYGNMTDNGFVSGEEGINIAVALNRKGEFADPFSRPTGPTAHVPPAFPFVTAVVYRVFGYGRAGAAVRNGVNISGLALLYASFPAASAALGLGANAGILAGFGAAIYPSFRSSEVFRGRDEWAAALALLWLTILMHRMCAGTRTRIRDAALLGVGWGLLLHVQPASLTVLPVHGLIYLAFADHDAFRKRVGRGLLAAAVLVLVLAPWTIRNYRVLGAWTFIRDNSGIELYVSNGEGAQPSQEANQRSGWYRSVHPISSAAAVDEIRRLGEVNFNRRRLAEATAWIRANPERFRRLTLARMAAFWADLPSNPSGFAVRLSWSLLGWLGLFLMWRGGYRCQALLVTAILAVYPLVYYVVQYSNRYVVAVCFAIYLPAGFAVERLCSRVGAATRRHRRA